MFAISTDRSAVPTLLDALQVEYFTVRWRAALSLGRIGDARAIQSLLQTLKDPEAEVRAAAAALQEIAANRADLELHTLAKQALASQART